ncbi:peptide-methionine (S)-S-oxide reductase MsrA [Marinilongibacter aquaticus]|uniref:peptide-methionine (S)-S-oxide reductase MsrA n=1 Tax=Marinilongibacter aquaticus TaxID=2975157 RepID=UPI0021BD6BE6|nr:peptide-methionine (S)-S-oxide reductase MsrA [Marinilongibacter aquaticus]UBM57491.1 peptide-methionine (S)-S-oxide reductase MsrA [Marinilongibacter aquaticus]
MNESKNNLSHLTLAAGCFWCVEAVFQRLKGVETVESGYMGGHVDKPTYEQVCKGDTGHAEVIRIAYNAEELSFEALLEVFFKTHDPTTLNRQGNDVGTQYRSAIFYGNENEKNIASALIKDLDKSGAYSAPIVTTLEPSGTFFKAEDYHQNYFNEKGDANPYCSFVVKPKVEKFEKVFADRLKA